MSASLVATGRSALKLRFLPGLPGKIGPANVLTIGTVTTGAAGSAAAAAITGTSPAQSLNLTIPKGDQGVAGPVSPLAVGTVTTGAPGSAASATITGSAPNQALNLTIPRGDMGAAGNGSGNVNPTGSGIAANKVALFADTIGNTIKAGPTLGDAAAKNTGSTNGTLAAGDDPRLVLNAPLLVTTNRTIVAGDFRRLLRFTGTTTQTLTAAATLGAAFSVLLSNEGAGIVTIAPTGSEQIDGVAAPLLLLPKQKAALVCDGGGFRVMWLDRYPVLADITIASPVGYIPPVVPPGWKRVALDFQLTVDTVGAQPRMQVSQDNDATVYTGNYFNQSLVGLPSGAVAGAQTTPYFAMGGATGTAKGSCTVDGSLDVDPTSLIKLRVGGIQNGSGQSEARLEGGYTGVIGAITNLRVYASAGNISGRTVIRGVF